MTMIAFGGMPLALALSTTMPGITAQGTPPAMMATTSQAPTPAAAAAACTRRFGNPLPRGPVQGWITADDYPPGASRAGEKGRVAFRINVGVNGRVENVEILESAGAALDAATQKVLLRRGRFAPAMRDCQPVPGEYEDKVVWDLPE